MKNREDIIFWGILDLIFLRAVIDDVPKNTKKIYGFSPLIKILFLLVCFDWLTSLFCMCVCGHHIRPRPFHILTRL
jgi:hypothetical protein